MSNNCGSVYFDNGKSIAIIVATHKKTMMPTYEIYLPLEVGAAIREKHTEYVLDDCGRNISKKNAYFCELTGLYWGWKNLDVEYVGLVHYRRFFTKKGMFFSKNEKTRLGKVLSSVEAEEVLRRTNIILPKKRHYFVETLYNHYRHTMFVEPLDMTGDIIREKYPKYYDEFLKLKHRKSAHMFNMMVMKKQICDEYCEWLFDILFELEKRVQSAGLEYDAFHSRFYGRISELLMDVYVDTNRLEYEEMRVMDLRPVNWIKKGGSFLVAKFFGRKYDKSF